MPGRLNDWLRSRKEPLSLLSAIILSIALMFSNGGEPLQTVKSWSLGGLGLILEKVSVVKTAYGLHDENQWLRRQNAKLLIENSRLQEALLENRRLRDLLNFKEESALDLIPAKVIGTQEHGFINSIILDAGRADSLQKNMAVVTAQGLVGKIFSVGEHYSVAQLLLDRNFRASAMVQRSRINGIIRWRQGERLELGEIPVRSDVRPNDVVVTSTVSSIFPSGILIGKVKRVEPEDMFLQIDVRPAVDFNKLEEVFIVRKQQRREDLP